MRNSIQKSCLRLTLCLALVGSFKAVYADEQASGSRLYRQEVRRRLQELQSQLDLLLANHQLMTDQYRTESERIRQLKLQMRVDSQENEPMTKEDRDTDFDLIRQINQEVSQWAVANSSGAPVNGSLPSNK